MATDPGPLEGVRVIDFSTLLPGPLATLILAEAGAEVIKIERPGRGDEPRDYEPKLGAGSAGFALLNRGKRSLALDLKDGAARARLEPLLAGAAVLVEQFRPGVMARLGLGHAAVRELNPRIVYCSLTGYGQNRAEGRRRRPRPQLHRGYRAARARRSRRRGRAPAIPPGLIADIGGGALPAVINILLALRRAEATGQGCHLDVAMTDNLFAWQWWAQGLLASGRAPRPRARAADRRLAALPGLFHCRRPLRCRSAARGALLAALLRADRAARGAARRAGRARGGAPRHCCDHRRATCRALAAALRGRRLLLQSRREPRGGDGRPALSRARPVRSADRGGRPAPPCPGRPARAGAPPAAGYSSSPGARRG